MMRNATTTVRASARSWSTSWPASFILILALAACDHLAPAQEEAPTALDASTSRPSPSVPAPWEAPEPPEPTLGTPPEVGGAGSQPPEEESGGAPMRKIDDTCCDPGDPQWLVCQDGLFCNGQETCTCWGQCEPGAPVNCDDGNPATVDRCIEGPPPGCDHGIRECFQPADCDDSNPCTDDRCEAFACVRTALPVGSSCDDALWCNGGGVCDALGACVPTLGPCTLPCQGCNELLRECTILTGYCLIGGACYAAGATNPLEQCQSCQPSLSRTDWSWKAPGTRCDDGLFCTLTDTCNAARQCVGTGARCPAAAGCVGGCDEAADTCVVQPLGFACRASVGFCDPAETCDGVSPFCPPNDPAAMNGVPCDDGDDCTENDVCLGGFCTGTLPPLGCPAWNFFGVTGGGAVTSGPSYRMTIGAGAPQAMGTGSTASYRLTIGPAALH